MSAKPTENRLAHAHFLWLRIQAAHAIVELVPDRVLRDLIERSADQVPERVTAEDVAAQQNHVDDQHQGSDADPEAVGETEKAFTAS